MLVAMLWILVLSLGTADYELADVHSSLRDCRVIPPKYWYVSSTLFHLQCPLDIATLDKVAALPIETSTPCDGPLSLYK